MRDEGGHVVLNADDLFRCWPEYASDWKARRRLGSILYPIARKFIDAAFQRLLAEAPETGSQVVLTAGGGASGKSTILRALADREKVDFIVDTTLSNSSRAFTQVDAALAAGRFVEINYIYREFVDPVRGMVERTLDPSVGRIVPIDDLARTHFGAQETMFALMERYADEPRVAIRLWETLRGGRGKRLNVAGLISRRLPHVDEV